MQTVLKLITPEERESLKSSSSQEPRASGKRDALFSSRSDELGKQFEAFMFRFGDPANVGKSLHDGNKDHLLNQARSDQVESLNNRINERQQQAYAQGLEFQDAHHGYIESRREQSLLQEESSMKENFSEIIKYKIFMNLVRRRQLKNYELTNSEYRN